MRIFAVVCLVLAFTLASGIKLGRSSATRDVIELDGKRGFDDNTDSVGLLGRLFRQRVERVSAPRWLSLRGGAKSSSSKKKSGKKSGGKKDGGSGESENPLDKFSKVQVSPNSLLVEDSTTEDHSSVSLSAAKMEELGLFAGDTVSDEDRFV